MKALELKKINRLNLRDMPIPEPKEGQVKVKVTRCALCRTDAKIWKSGHRDLILPRILGHEFCGTREDNGKRCVVWPGKACGLCYHCCSGYENLCVEMSILGFHENGGLAEYSIVPESSLIDVPENLSDDLACLAEPLSCTLNALELAGIMKGQSVLIFGAGTVGLLMAIGVKHKGANPFISEVNYEKLERSRQFREMVGISIIDDFTKDIGFDAAINATPSPATFLDGIEKLGSRGCFCIFSGLIPGNVANVSEFLKAINEIHYRQLRVTGAYGCTREQIKLSLHLLNEYQDAVSLLVERYIGLEDVTEVLPEILSGRSFKYVVKVQD